MGAIFVRQPNGLYCRYSTMVDSVTHFNCTAEEVRHILMDPYEEAVDRLLAMIEQDRNPWHWTWQDVLDRCETGLENDNVSREEFERFLRLATNPVTEEG